jgi:hypothetical protein
VKNEIRFKLPDATIVKAPWARTHAMFRFTVRRMLQGVGMDLRKPIRSWYDPIACVTWYAQTR